MTRRGSLRAIVSSVACVVGAAPGCTLVRPPIPEAAPTSPVAVGTSREDVLRRYGAPHRAFEDGRILTWEIASDAAVTARGRYRCPDVTRFGAANSTLVVVFDASGRTVRCAAVPVHARPPAE